MRPRSVAATLTAIQCLAGCSPLKPADVEEVRRVAVSSQEDFRRIASVLEQSSIIWADGKNVRYRLGVSDYRTDSWATAELSPAIRSELREFISALHIRGIFLHQRRVNFVLRATGIVPSGDAVGVIVAPADEHDCSEVVTSVKLDRRGRQCERLHDATYFYLRR
jgi:hypothetical protein